MLRRLYDWIMSLAGGGHSEKVLAGVSFAESSVFPIPPDALLIPMVLKNPDRAWRIAFICTAASVLGGLAGYGIGYFLFEQIGRPVMEFYGHTAKFGTFRETYNEWGAWSVFIAGVTPFPYKVITILSGVTRLDVVIFMTASVAARGLRFFLTAALLWKFGPPIRAFIEKRLGLVFAVSCVLLAGGFAAVKLLS